MPTKKIEAVIKKTFGGEPKEIQDEATQLTEMYLNADEELRAAYFVKAFVRTIEQEKAIIMLTEQLVASEGRIARLETFFEVKPETGRLN